MEARQLYELCSEEEFENSDKGLHLFDFHRDDVYFKLSPPQEDNTMAFAEWCALNDWILNPAEMKWFYKSDGNPESGKTTAALLAIFTEQNKK